MKAHRQTALLFGVLVWPAARAFHSLWLHHRGTASARFLSLNKYMERKREIPDATVRLQYSNSTMEEDEPRNRFTPKIRWLDTARRPSSVDEYLEFLDRRYHNLNTQTSLSETSTSSSFTPLKWMSPQSQLVQKNDEIRPQQDDAFKVLGVDGLASDRLLQKHAQQQDNESATAPLTLAGAFSQALRKRRRFTLRVLSIVRKRYQPNSIIFLRKISSIFVTGLVTVLGKLVSVGLDIGGGVATVQPTFEAILFLLLKVKEFFHQLWMRRGTTRRFHGGEWE